MDATEAYTRLWRVIRASNGRWRLASVAGPAWVNEREAAEYVQWLVQMGLVRRVGHDETYGWAYFRMTLAGRETLVTPTPEGVERIELAFVREVESGAVRLVSESAPGAYDRIRAALTGPVESHKWGRRETIRDRLYAALRAHGGRVASSRELAELAEAKATTAQDYLRDLARAGCVAWGPDGWRATGELPVERPRAPEHRTIKRKGVQP
jgi:hypothetical protein